MLVFGVEPKNVGVVKSESVGVESVGVAKADRVGVVMAVIDVTKLGD